VEDLTRGNELIRDFEDIIKTQKPPDEFKNLKVGVDLGTANVVISVLDSDNKPVMGAIQPAQVVRDGLVVDYVGAIRIVKRLKARIEEVISLPLKKAATAIPPGVNPGDVKAIGNVVEAAGFELTGIVDEPTAAAKVLGIKNGAVVDVGGGTTGISVLKNGEVVYVADEPTGGTHFTLVLAGNYRVSFEEAERIKLSKERSKEVFQVLIPVMEKVGSIIRNHIQDKEVDTIYLVGGTSCINGIERVIETHTGIKAVKPVNPLLVTPLGIAMLSEEGGG